MGVVASSCLETIRALSTLALICSGTMSFGPSSLAIVFFHDKVDSQYSRLSTASIAVTAAAMTCSALGAWDVVLVSRQVFCRAMKSHSY